MLPLLGTPLLLVFAVVLDVGLVLFMVLSLSLIMAVGVLMEEGPVAQLAVPLVLSMGVSVILFQALSNYLKMARRHCRRNHRSAHASCNTPR